MLLNWCCKCDFFLCLAFIIKLRHVPYKSVYLCDCSWIIMRVAFKVHFTFRNHSIWSVYLIMVLVANFLHAWYFVFEMFNAISSRRNIWHISSNQTHRIYFYLNIIFWCYSYYWSKNLILKFLPFKWITKTDLAFTNAREINLKMIASQSFYCNFTSVWLHVM